MSANHSALRRVPITEDEMLSLEIGQKFKGGIVRAINRADLWAELTPDPFPGTVLRQEGVYRNPLLTGADERGDEEAS